MKLTARKLGKSDKSDLLVCTRDDGSTTQVAMPRQGVLPHDLLHFIVETALPLRHGFLSQAAAGGSIAIDAGMSYVEGPAQHVMESGQVESLVEALQTQLWAGAYRKVGSLTFASDVYILDKLAELGIEPIWCHPGEEWGINCLTVRPGRVIMPDDSPRTAELLEKRGIEVVPIPYFELHKNGGGIHCSTMELRRDPAA